MKKMILAVIVLFIVGCDKVEEIKFSNTDHYKEELESRYINYQKINPNLSIEDIVTRVNIGLDKKFYENTSISNKLNNTNILVNKYIGLPNDYIPNNLVLIDKKYASRDISLVSEVAEMFFEMCKDIQDNGLNIRAISGYRSYNYQKNLYDDYVSKDSIDKADKYSARPGFSEHQTGLSVDIDNRKKTYEAFHLTEEYVWMTDNAYKYGFILRYPRGKENITGYNYESWHYRYVGKNIASYIIKTGITYDEYYIRFLDK